MKKSVAVIGAGITGLTAAFRLKQAGHTVTVFDAAERAGGVIRSVQRDGWLAECGPNTMLETSPLITKLVEDPVLGIAGQRREASPLGGNRFILKKRKTSDAARVARWVFENSTVFFGREDAFDG